MLSLIHEINVMNSGQEINKIISIKSLQLQIYVV